MSGCRPGTGRIFPGKLTRNGVSTRPFNGGPQTAGDLNPRVGSGRLSKTNRWRKIRGAYNRKRRGSRLLTTPIDPTRSSAARPMGSMLRRQARRNRRRDRPRIHLSQAAPENGTTSHMLSRSCSTPSLLSAGRRRPDELSWRRHFLGEEPSPASFKLVPHPGGDAELQSEWLTSCRQLPSPVSPTA